MNGFKSQVACMARPCKATQVSSRKAIVFYNNEEHCAKANKPKEKIFHQLHTYLKDDYGKVE